MGWTTPSGPDVPPVGSFEELTDLNSLRGPEGKLKSRRVAPEERTLSVTVPDSSSEPAMRRAVPVRVTSVICVFPICRLPMTAVKPRQQKSLAGKLVERRVKPRVKTKE